MFGSVILNLWCVCTVLPAGPAVPYTHTHTPQVQGERERENLNDLGVGGMIILKLALIK